VAGRYGITPRATGSRPARDVHLIGRHVQQDAILRDVAD
jgi:hypothetical protein